MRNMKSLSSQKVNIRHQCGIRISEAAQKRIRRNIESAKKTTREQSETCDKRYGRFTFLRPTSGFVVAIATTVVAVTYGRSAVITSIKVSKQQQMRAVRGRPTSTHHRD